MPHATPDDESTTPSAGPPHEQLVPGPGRGAEASEPAGAGSDRPVESDAAKMSEPPTAHEEVAIESEHRVKVRRTPRYGRFMILGGAVFAIAAFIATYSLPQDAGYDRNTVFGFVLLGAVAVGVGLGALAAIIASAATRRTERTVLADRIDVRREVDADTSPVPDLGELPAEAEHDDSGDAGTATKRDTE